MFYFDKNDPRVLFQDIRSFKDKDIYKGRTFSVEPDVIADFTSMPYPDNTFRMVVFDPPHLKYTSEKETKGWQMEKYGWLPRGQWKEIMTKGFIYVRDSIEIIKGIKDICNKTIKENIHNNYVDYNKIKGTIRDSLSRYLSLETGNKPMIITVIQEIDL